MTFEEELASTGRLVYTNKGTSMLPLLRQGRDVMVIEACPASQVEKLDAVLFVRTRGEAKEKGQGPGQGLPQERKDYVLHRVLRVNPDGTFWIIGDHCLSGETVSGDQILGRLTAVIREGRTLSVRDPLYRCYLHLWCRPYRLRIFLLRGRNFLKRGLRFLKRRISGR